MNGESLPGGRLPTLRREDSMADKPDDWHDELVRLIALAYEGAWDLADRAGADFSIIGEPLERALRVLRGMRP